jgi:hypothetical protein
MLTRILNATVAVGLAALVAYGVLAWWPERGHFPSDMRDATLRAEERGSLRAASLAAPDADPLGQAAVEELGRAMGLPVEWTELPASSALRLLDSASIDVVAHFDEELPASEAYGLTRPYHIADGSRLVLAVPAGENRLLAEADRAVRSVTGNAER